MKTVSTDNCHAVLWKCQSHCNSVKCYWTGWILFPNRVELFLDKTHIVIILKVNTIHLFDKFGDFRCYHGFILSFELGVNFQFLKEEMFV